MIETNLNFERMIWVEGSLKSWENSVISEALPAKRSQADSPRTLCEPRSRLARCNWEHRFHARRRRGSEPHQSCDNDPAAGLRQWSSHSSKAGWVRASRRPPAEARANTLADSQPDRWESARARLPR